MRARDLAANLIAEIAEECGYCVCSYTASGDASGNITFTLIEDQEYSDGVADYRYKLLSYKKEKVYLTTTDTLKAIEPISLNSPESVDMIMSWFSDGDHFDSPYGSLFSNLATSPFTYTHNANQNVIITSPSNSVDLNDYTSISFNDKLYVVNDKNVTKFGSITTSDAI